MPGPTTTPTTLTLTPQPATTGSDVKDVKNVTIDEARSALEGALKGMSQERASQAQAERADKRVEEQNASTQERLTRLLERFKTSRFNGSFADILAESMKDSMDIALIYNAKIYGGRNRLLPDGGITLSALADGAKHLWEKLLSKHKVTIDDVVKMAKVEDVGGVGRVSVPEVVSLPFGKENEKNQTFKELALTADLQEKVRTGLHGFLQGAGCKLVPKTDDKGKKYVEVFDKVSSTSTEYKTVPMTGAEIEKKLGDKRADYKKGLEDLAKPSPRP